MILCMTKGADPFAPPSGTLINQRCIKWGISESFAKRSKPDEIKGLNHTLLRKNRVLRSNHVYDIH
jgi:hypothetical protein